MTEIYEALKGFTDIPLAILSLIFGIILVKKRRTGWGILFLTVAVAAVMGTVAHAVAIPTVALNLLWTVLYVFLYEAIRRFGCLTVALITGESRPEPRVIFCAEGILYILTLLWMWLGWPLNDILVLVVFMVMIFVRVTVCIVRTRHVPRSLCLLMGILLIPILLQMFESVIPYAVVAEHTLLALSLCVAFAIALHTPQKTEIIQAR